MARAYALSMVAYTEKFGHEDYLVGIYKTKKQAEKVKRFLESAVSDMGRLYDETDDPDDYTFHIQNALVDSRDLVSTLSLVRGQIRFIDKSR